MQAGRMRMMAAGVTAAALFLAGGLAGLAQDASPMAGMTGMGHPTHIHEGTCANLDPNPAYPLTDLGPTGGETDAATAPVERSVTTVDVALSDLLANPYAINVHESAENLANYIACGDIAGEPAAGADGQGEELAIALRQQNDSGFAGIALLQAAGEAQTTVSLFLAPDLATGSAATGSADSAASAADAQAATSADAAAADTIRIVDFSFAPATLQVPVGSTLTWVNDGPTAHTTTAYDGGAKIWDSGILNAGQSYEHTFDAAGSFDYVCTLHPSMTGHIDVVA